MERPCASGSLAVVICHPPCLRRMRGSGTVTVWTPRQESTVIVVAGVTDAAAVGDVPVDDQGRVGSGRQRNGSVKGRLPKA